MNFKSLMALTLIGMSLVVPAAWAEEPAPLNELEQHQLDQAKQTEQDQAIRDVQEDARRAAEELQLHLHRKARDAALAEEAARAAEAAPAVSVEEKKPAQPKHEASATYKVVNGDVTGYGGAVSLKMRHRARKDADLVTSGSLGGVGKTATGSASIGIELSKKEDRFRLGSQFFLDSSPLVVQSGVKLTGMRKMPGGKLMASITPIGYDFNRLNKTSGFYSGLGVGVEQDVLGLFTASGLLDVALGYGQGRELIIETEYISPTERVQKIARTGMEQDGANTVVTARGALKRNVGAGQIEVYGQLQGRNAQFNETGFDGMVLDKSNANNGTSEVGVTAVLPF